MRLEMDVAAIARSPFDGGADLRVVQQDHALAAGDLDRTAVPLVGAGGDAAGIEREALAEIDLHMAGRDIAGR
ncbi:MAG: hypothetical protein AW09_004355 [Candidatus Accumulibacter phosphatis]|uniref:Uncharacterized protein n=1 Tax=Candidatus Accumulibacter phosphatis TaxID=327160 RepID=A0A080LR06_9PROT|nr:MAG: hypothetical protein AW09_004355 [Candidatus Accumulibacter phosphatis]